jgi:hypothetical protein
MSERISKFWRLVGFFGAGMEREEKTQAIRDYLRAMKEYFAPKGFRYKRGGYDAFVKTESEMTFSFGLGLDVHLEAFFLRHRAGIRHETVEQLFHQVSGDPDTVRRDSGTVLWNWALRNRQPRNWQYLVDRKTKVPKAVHFTQQFYLQWVDPFFAECGTLRDIDKSFNENQAALRIKNPHDWFELLARALIVAKLAGRQDYKTLKDAYRAHLCRHKSLRADAVECFDRLAGLLETLDQADRSTFVGDRER